MRLKIIKRKQIPEAVYADGKTCNLIQVRMRNMKEIQYKSMAWNLILLKLKKHDHLLKTQATLSFKTLNTVNQHSLWKAHRLSTCGPTPWWILILGKTHTRAIKTHNTVRQCLVWGPVAANERLSSDKVHGQTISMHFFQVVHNLLICDENTLV